ncbi:MAG TPA: DUF3710 domain-containing protein [Natronosporangium sp.]|nr:DUF3710 domain-containing protein [Natronosporangium sp.]
MFSRGRSPGRHARSRSGRRERSGPPAAHSASAAPGGASVPEPAPPAPTVQPGPYDISEAPEGVKRLDLGSLQIPAVPGVEVRVQARPDGAVGQVFLVHGDSSMQLGAYAAPRTEPIWDEVRAEIRESLRDAVAVEEIAGPYGTELRARVRAGDAVRDVRFVGVNGPRWLVRAVYQGPAAVDPARAGLLAQCLAGVVVDRGREARPVREPLPLRLSPEVASRMPRPPGAGGVIPAG